MLAGFKGDVKTALPQVGAVSMDVVRDRQLGVGMWRQLALELSQQAAKPARQLVIRMLLEHSI